MSPVLQSILFGTSALSVLVATSLLISHYRNPFKRESLNSIRITVYIGVVLHLCHSSEEALTGFHRRFPELLGLAPWPIGFFISFNLIWISIWLISLRYLAQHKIFVAAIWFLTLASLLNGLSHPAISLAVGGYFPGLYSSPLLAVLGIILLRQLRAGT